MHCSNAVHRSFSADPAAAEDAANRLQSAQRYIRPLDDFVLDLEDLKTALNDIVDSAAISQMTDIESSIVSVSSTIADTKTSLQTVESDLHAFQTEYDNVSPCLNDFFDKIATIGHEFIEYVCQMPTHRSASCYAR